MNKVINKYGAFSGEAVDYIDDYVKDLGSAIIRACEDLDPAEVRLLGAYIEMAVSVRISEIALGKAIKMRRTERGR